jgi:hypothetical protein
MRAPTYEARRVVQKGKVEGTSDLCSKLAPKKKGAPLVVGGNESALSVANRSGLVSLTPGNLKSCGDRWIIGAGAEEDSR